MWSLVAGIGNLHKDGWHLVNILETGFSCLERDLQAKFFQSVRFCKICGQLSISCLSHPLFSSQTWTNTPLPSASLHSKLPSSQGEETRGRGRGEEIGPVAKAVFSATAPARSIWDTQQAEVSLFRWHFGQYLLIDGRKREKKNRRGIIREGWEQQRHFVFLFPS